MSVAVITGAASGMGRACAERFVAEGWQVAALDLADPDVGGAIAVAVDITDAAAVTAAIERVVAELGAPKTVVNAAGVYPPSTLQTATTELYRRTFDVNVLALELGPHVRVNALAPGWVDTPGNRASGRMEAALASVPLGRAATPEEMADLVWFLGGEGRAGYVTGETLTATGGSAF
jgi:NAD(P)-dependent dehydrogenase (short-subunit alcohol dehydrogenase family)